MTEDSRNLERERKGDNAVYEQNVDGRAMTCNFLVTWHTRRKDVQHHSIRTFA